MRIRTLAAAAALAIGATAPASTQTQTQPPPIFRATSDLVEVDVIVRDRSGRFVSDLAPADFEIQEQGAEQPIQQFYLHLTTSNGWPVNATPGAQPIPASPEAARRTFVVLFDSAHMSGAGFKRTQAAAAVLFSQHFRNGDVGGVVIDGRLSNNRLTTDREDLLKTIRNAKPSAAQNSRIFDEQQWPRLTEAEAMRIAGYEDKTVLAAAVSRACADDENACRGGLDVAGLIRQKATMLSDTVRASTNATLQSLNALVGGLGRFEGRKTVVLLSEGFIADSAWPLVRQTVETAVRTNTRIYTLDARGLDRGMSQRLAAASIGDDDPGLNLLNNTDPGSDSINSLAVDTGGFVIRNANVFDRAIAQIVDDASNYYILGYRPVTPQDGKFHQISVKVNRPGLFVRARRGYVATPRPAQVSTAAEARAASSSVTAPAASRSETVEERAASGATPSAAPVQSEPVAESSAPTPAASAGASSVAPGRIVTPSGTVRVRPAAAAHVGELVTGTTADADATAGWDAYQRGDVETARASLAVAAARPASHPWIHYALGQSEYALGHYAAAVAAWEKVRADAADFEPVYFDLVDGYMQEKDYDKAIRLLRGAKEKWPRDPEIFNALGVVQTVRGALDDAIKSFEGAIAIAPAETTSYFNLGKAHELRYFRSRHYVQQTRMWMANESDRTAAIQHYEQYLAAGGPYAQSARDGLARLRWIPDQKR